MLFWANLLGYQIVWFIAVIGAARGFSWPAVLAGSIFTAITSTLSRQRSLDLKLIAIALGIGMINDGGLESLHLVEFATPDPAIPPFVGAPVWILAIWMSFAVTLNRSLAWLKRRPLLAAAFGAVGGPLAYSGAGRGWGALEFQAPLWRGELWLGVSWAVSMYLFAYVMRAHERKEN